MMLYLKRYNTSFYIYDKLLFYLYLFRKSVQIEHWRDGKPIIRIVPIFICYFSHLNNNPENAIHAAIRSRLLEVVSGSAKSPKDGK